MMFATPETGVIGVLALLALLLVGTPIGVALGMVGIGGLAIVIGLEPAVIKTGVLTFETLSRYELGTLPLFLLMAHICFAAQASRDFFDVAAKFLGHRRGGLAFASVGGCAAFGSMPEAARVRDKNRHLPDIIMLPRVTAYVYNRLDFHRKRHIRLTMDNTFKKIRTGMLIISNNCYVPGERGAFYKETLQEGVLGVYTVTPKSLWDKIRLAVSMHTGAWKSDPSVTEAHANTVVINTNRKTELISLDGEPLEMKMPLRCHVMKQALQVIVPMPVAAEASEAA